MKLKTLKLKTPGIQKFLTLQIYAYVYQRIIDFPRRKFHHQTLTRNYFFLKLFTKLSISRSSSLASNRKNYWVRT